MPGKDQPPTPPKTLRLQRVFDCPPDRLWATWTDPKEYAKWLNPAPGHDLVIHEWDLRPGGKVRFDMPQPDGNRNPQEGVFLELEPYRRLVTGEEDRSFVIEATFEPVGKKTKLTVVVTGLPADFHQPATVGWNQGFDKLEGVLSAGETRTLRIERTFACTREEMWYAWTQADQLAKWFGPFDIDNDVDSVDPRPGGVLKLAMRDPDGGEHPIHGAFLTLDEPNELAFCATADEIGGHVATVRVTFEERDGRTHVVLEQCGLPTNVTEETGQGWRLSWDKLGVLVAEDRTVVISRLIDAPRESVFDAFTDPDEVANWWGPDGFTTTTKEMDVRPGGKWVFTMHGPDGTDYPNWIRYEEVLRPERLAYAHGGGRPGDTPDFHATTTFYEQDGQTLVTLRSVFPTADAKEHVVREYNAIEGGKQTLARLAEHVAGVTHAQATPGAD